jgi:splicing factor 1
MWRPATKQITGTNDSVFLFFLISCPYSSCAVPLGGNRRRFGPAPVEESAPPQLAQPSPSAYPRPRDDSSRMKEESLSTGTLTPGKLAATYSLHCIVHIGNSGTLHRIDVCLSAR